jgi:PAS domain S-box-containing protein
MVRARSAALPIIIVSGAVNEQMIADVAKLGANDYLLKDRLNRLGQAVRHLLEERRARERMQVTESEMQRSEIRYRALFEQASDGVILAEAETGLVIEANPRAAEMLGVCAADMAGKACHALVPPDAAGVVRDCLVQCMRGAAPERYAMALPRPDGASRDVEISAALVEFPDSTSVIQAIFRDVTEQKTLEAMLRSERDKLEAAVEARTAELTSANAELREAVLQLEAANAMKRRFLRHMHHELKTPLTAVIGTSGFLLDRDPAPEHRDSLEQINRAGEHLLRLITDMLDLSEIESGTIRFSIGNLPPRLAFESPIGVLSDRIARKGLTVYLRIDPLLRAIRGDIQRCHQIMINLLTNAIKFTPEGGRITVAAEYREPETAVISVSDTGIGIEEKDLPAVFDEFFQADQVRDRALGGTGIGLALVKSLVERQGGRITVESTVGLGTTFRFTLPGVRADGEPAAIEGGSAHRPAMRTRRRNGEEAP